MENPIDLTRYNTFCFEGVKEGGNFVNICVVDKKNNSYNKVKYKEIVSNDGFVEIDISSLVGYYYLCMEIGKPYSSDPPKITINKFWVAQ